MALDDPLAPMAVMSASISPTSLANNGLGRHSPVGLAIDGEVESDGGSSVDGEGDAEDEFVIRSRGVGDGEYTNGYGGVTKSPDVHTYTSKDETKLQIERYPLTIRYRFHRH